MPYYWFSLKVISVFLLLFTMVSCTDPDKAQKVRGDIQNTKASVTYSFEELVEGPIQPIPLEVHYDTQKVELGRRLFFEPRLSHDNSVSCGSCHLLLNGGEDGLPFPMGIQGKKGSVNTPTVLNSAFNLKQFWDGRVNSLEAQVHHPIHNPKEMNSNWKEVIQKLSQDSSYVNAFRRVYQQRVSENGIQDAIGAFERTLITPNSRFDQYLRGHFKALSKIEQEGYQLFMNLGCVACHHGVNIGGNSFQKMGQIRNYFEDRGGELTKEDLGRYNVTGYERDKYKFKVPSLRNVEKTAPYFHDASAKTLEDAVAVMALYQLGYKLSQEQVDKLVAFLKALTGEVPKTALPSDEVL